MLDHAQPEVKRQLVWIQNLLSSIWPIRSRNNDKTHKYKDIENQISTLPTCFEFLKTFPTSAMSLKMYDKTTLFKI